MCRNWSWLQSIPADIRSSLESRLARSTNPRSTKCNSLAFRRTRATGLRASCQGRLNRPFDRRSRNFDGHRSDSVERINFRGFPGQQRTLAGTVIRNSTKGRWANGCVQSRCCHSSGVCNIRSSSMLNSARKYLRRSGGACIQISELKFPTSERPIRLAKLGTSDVSVLLTMYDPSMSA